MEHNNIIYTDSAKSETAVIMEEHFDSMNAPDTVVCDKCLDETEPNLHGGISGYDCLCEYCYSEELGEDVYACDDCNTRTYNWLKFVNTEHGLYCKTCYDFREEDEHDVDK
jgi:hypothetical protein